MPTRSVCFRDTIKDDASSLRTEMTFINLFSFCNDFALHALAYTVIKLNFYVPTFMLVKLEIATHSHYFLLFLNKYLNKLS